MMYIVCLLPQTTPERAYWRQWWHTSLAKMDATKKQAYYKKIWDRIRAGTLTRQGHGI